MKQLYEIRPFRPIRNPGHPYIGKITRLRLEMEEVKYYMDYGTIYRIFENSTASPVKVTGANLAELHGVEEDIVSTTEIDDNNTSIQGSKDEEKNLTEEEYFTVEDKAETTKNNDEDTTSSTTIDKKPEVKPWINSSQNKNYNNYKGKNNKK